MVDPIEPKSKSRAILCLPVNTVFDCGLKEWLGANVREQKMGSSIAKDIIRTLDERPDTMHPLNRGITVLSNGFRYDSQSKTFTILLRDPKRHGVIDGGHTFRAIEQVVQKRLDAGLEAPNAFVHVEVLAGYDEIASDIISARNSVAAVRDSAIYALEGVFDDIRHHLRKAKIEDLIAFRQNEQNKKMTVEEVLAVCTLFHPTYADGSSHPMKAYTSRASCVELYHDEWQKAHSKSPDSTAWKKGFGKIIHLAPDLLRFSEEIEMEADEARRRIGGLQALKATEEKENGTKDGKSRGRAMKELSGPRELPITGKTVKSGWPTGYLYPIVAAMRPLVDYSGEVAKWKVADPMQVCRAISNDLVKTLLAYAEEYGRKPNAVGKSLLCWKSLYDTVEVGLLRAQAQIGKQ
ncbi:MAG TPA: AIPR family protein [Verrucomicrobiae bacterium]|nr:AIPR family protein [Verrucomicrobiae bacterium]